MKKAFVLLACAAFLTISTQAQTAQAQPAAAQPQAQPVGTQPQAQPPQRAQYLIITIYEYYGIGGNTRMIQTLEDGSQLIKDLDWKDPYNFKRLTWHDDSLMAALKPFFDEGWNLVSTNAITGGTGTSSGAIITRFFLKKEQ